MKFGPQCTREYDPDKPAVLFPKDGYMNSGGGNPRQFAVERLVHSHPAEKQPFEFDEVLFNVTATNAAEAVRIADEAKASREDQLGWLRKDRTR